MDGDPNWFYSTLAQSTAAIVGLAGGFFVQRLLAQRSELGEDREDLRSDFQSLMNEIGVTRSQALAVVGAMAEAIEEIEKLKQDGRNEFTLHSEFFFSMSHQRGYLGDMVPEQPVEKVEPLIHDTCDAAHALAGSLPATEPELFEVLDRVGDLETTPATYGCAIPKDLSQLGSDRRTSGYGWSISEISLGATFET